VLRVGVKCDSPPFGSLDPSGKPVGIEVSMARRIAEFAFGSPDKVDLQCVTSEARIPSLNGQKIDIILATLGKFPERQKVIDFTEYYMWGTSNVMVPKDSPATKLAELKDKNICIVKGGSQAKWLNENIPGIKLTQLNTTSDCVQALRQGRVDGLVGDGGLIWSLSSNYPDLRVIEEGLDLAVAAGQGQPGGPGRQRHGHPAARELPQGRGQGAQERDDRRVDELREDHAAQGARLRDPAPRAAHHG
jgi:polar amino acid transport system substrate-binding protein